MTPRMRAVDNSSMRSEAGFGASVGRLARSDIQIEDIARSMAQRKSHVDLCLDRDGLTVEQIGPVGPGANGFDGRFLKLRGAAHHFEVGDFAVFTDGRQQHDGSLDAFLFRAGWILRLLSGNSVSRHDAGRKWSRRL